MEWIIAAIVVLTAWAVLRVIGNERARQIYCVQVKIAIEREEKLREEKRNQHGGESVTIVR